MVVSYHFEGIVTSLLNDSAFVFCFCFLAEWLKRSERVWLHVVHVTRMILSREEIQQNVKKTLNGRYYTCL